MPLTLPSFHWKIEEKIVFFLKCNKYFKVIVVVYSFLPPPPPPLPPNLMPSLSKVIINLT